MDYQQLRELKELLDAGILTQEEFDAQKALIRGVAESSPSPVTSQPALANPSPDSVAAATSALCGICGAQNADNVMLCIECTNPLQSLDNKQNELQAVRELSAIARRLRQQPITGTELEQMQARHDLPQKIAEFWKTAYVPRSAEGLVEATKAALVGAEPTMDGNWSVPVEQVILLARAELCVSELENHPDANPSVLASFKAQLFEKQDRHKNIKKQGKRYVFFLVGGILLAIVLLFLFIGGDDDGSEESEGSDGESISATERERRSHLPEFAAMRERMCDEYRNAGSDIQRSRVFQQLKSAMSMYREVDGMQGTIKAIETSSRAARFAVVRIDAVGMEFNNISGGLFDHHYVDRGTRVWNQIKDMNDGAKVVFSGDLLAVDENPFSEKLSVCGKTWSVRYTDIRPR